mgnify:CR=1 FL=1
MYVCVSIVCVCVCNNVCILVPICYQIIKRSGEGILATDGVGCLAEDTCNLHHLIFIQKSLPIKKLTTSSRSCGQNPKSYNFHNWQIVKNDPKQLLMKVWLIWFIILPMLIRFISLPTPIGGQLHVPWFLQPLMPSTISIEISIPNIEATYSLTFATIPYALK